MLFRDLCESVGIACSFVFSRSELVDLHSEMMQDRCKSRFLVSIGYARSANQAVLPRVIDLFSLDLGIRCVSGRRNDSLAWGFSVCPDSMYELVLFFLHCPREFPLYMIRSVKRVHKASCHFMDDIVYFMTDSFFSWRPIRGVSSLKS